MTFSKEDMPIVIGDVSLRGKKIGRRGISALIGPQGLLGLRNYMCGIYTIGTRLREDVLKALDLLPTVKQLMEAVTNLSCNRPIYTLKRRKRYEL